MGHAEDKGMWVNAWQKWIRYCQGQGPCAQSMKLGEFGDPTVGSNACRFGPVDGMTAEHSAMGTGRKRPGRDASWLSGGSGLSRSGHDTVNHLDSAWCALHVYCLPTLVLNTPLYDDRWQ